MTWVKLDDQFADHPKVEQAGPLAAWLHVAAICYCARQLTDGRIPKAKARRLADVPTPAKQIARLIEVGLWHDAGDDYIIHDYLDYQPSRAEVESKHRDVSEARSSAGKKGADARWGDGKGDGKPHGKGDGPAIADGWQSDGKADGKAMAPSRSRPVGNSSSASEGKRVNPPPGADDDHPPPANPQRIALAALELAADRRCTGRTPDDPAAYRATVLAAIRAEHWPAAVDAAKRGQTAAEIAATINPPANGHDPAATNARRLHAATEHGRSWALAGATTTDLAGRYTDRPDELEAALTAHRAATQGGD